MKLITSINQVDSILKDQKGVTLCSKETELFLGWEVVEKIPIRPPRCWADSVGMKGNNEGGATMEKVQLPAGCTCEGTLWTDSMCVHCLKEMECRVLEKIDELEESIQPIQERIEELEFDLDIIRWHIDNPLCSGGCGENTAHCQCDIEPNESA